jgi:hypothetical protein
MSGFKQSMEEVLSSCSIVFLSLLNTFSVEIQENSTESIDI